MTPAAFSQYQTNRDLERQVYDCVMQGLTCDGIAQRLQLDPVLTRQLVNHILAKLCLDTGVKQALTSLWAY
jgi:DNA-binding CsgD family transcriptional regulator